MTKNERAKKLLAEAKKRGSVLGLSRIKALLREMGDPQDGLRVIHISGTNGKGSFGASLGAILTSAGFLTGSFASPAVTSETDYFRIDGREISSDELDDILCCIAPLWEALDDKPTEFEVITAAAFELFRRRGCDVALVECGLGGDTDSTNVIASPLLSVITNVQRDHIGVLGNSIAEIASRKAGIIKSGRPVLFGGTDKKALAVISKAAAAAGSELTLTDFTRVSDAKLGEEGTSFRFEGFGELRSSLIGACQLENAANVLTAVEILRGEGLVIPDCAVRQGLASAKWPARFEIIRREPTVIYDGAHNPAGIRRAAETIAALYPNKKPVLLAGVMADKEYGLYADILGGLVCEVFAVKPANPRSLDADELAETFSVKGVPARSFRELGDGVREAFAAAKRKNVPLIALGTLYMYAEFRKALI